MTRMYAKRWLPVLERLEEGLLVITASNRQADFLRQQYRYYSQQQNRVWYRPAIVTEKQWLSSLFQHFMIHHGTDEAPWRLLSDQESRLIWEQIIENDGDYLLDTRRTAERVRQAANRLEQWLLADSITEDDSFDWRTETRCFRDWHQLATRECQKNYWLESSQLDAWLSEKVELLLESNTAGLMAEQMGLIGFQQISPAKQQFFDALEAAGIELQFLSPEPVESEIYRLELPDTHGEIKQAAVWAKAQWQANPNQRIGIVLPNLNNNRELVRLIFERQFCPSEILKSDDQMHRPYDISLGLPLSSYPLIDCALMLFNLMTKPLPQDEVVQLLLSPYLISAEQQSEVIDIIRLLRKSRQLTVSIADLIYLSSQSEDEDTPLKETLLTLKAFEINGKLAPSQWAIKFAELLEQIGWCDKRPLSSTEFQTREAWYKRLEKMAIYDQLSGNISCVAFLGMFRRVIHETLFQPQTGDCPIQIMGLLESTFLTFDKIRICAIDNRLWPDTARPSPFIPYELQRLHDMPNATAERELRVSKALFQLLSGAAEEVIFSHARGNGEESLGVSPILEHLELRQAEHTSGYQPPAEQINLLDKQIEYIDDTLAPTLTAATVKGGSKLLQDIARCQFRAFAHHRLHANAADQPSEGLDPMDRGNLVHKILEKCWLHLFDKQQSKLIELHQSEQLEAAIEPYIERELENLQQQRHTPVPAPMINLEKLRLTRLLLEWFEMEIERPAFTVKELEQSVNAPIAGTSIHLQLDRIDELEDGSLAVIDYKTGKVDRKNWFGDRPDEPQLPMYAVVLSDQEQKIGALLYGQVKSSESRFHGVADDKSLVSGVHKNFDREPLSEEKEKLEQQVTQWRAAMQQLIEEYLAGESAVTPKDEKVCQYCDLHGLCRISEMSQRTQEPLT